MVMVPVKVQHDNVMQFKASMPLGKKAERQK